MGARIAAHFANAGVPVLLLDRVLQEHDRNALAKQGIQAAAQQKPAGFFAGECQRLVTPGNFDDDLPKLAECDWIIEAVVEDLAVKREIWRRVEAHRRAGAILSTNTSGIRLEQIAEGFPDDFRRAFLGTHFFNPPRYLHLVELIPGPATDADYLVAVNRFCDQRLGKGVTPCKDTPCFIANRIGAFFSGSVQKLMVEGDYSIEDAEALTGPLIGLPKSASFRLLDIIGLDVWAFIGANLYEAAPEDPWRERFPPRDYVSRMIERGWLGEKAGQGFYRWTVRDGDRVLEVIDWKTLEYHEARQPGLPGLETALHIKDLPSRLRHLVTAKDRGGEFVWKLLGDLLLYSAERIPEISDRVVEIDRAMRWGYAFKLGPFELWDSLGFEQTARRLESEGRRLPESIHRMLAGGATSFYRPADADRSPRTEYWDLERQAYVEREERPGIVSLPELKRARGVVRDNEAGSLVDLGDGVLCVEFHSKMNTLGEESFAMIEAGLEETERHYEAMVIANQGEHFSAGANLMLILLAAQEKDWEQIERYLKRFQEANMALRRAAKPVVAAPFGHTLGGGCEVALHAARRQASAELYMGLVEINVGLIPAAGGTKQMLMNLGDGQRAFDLIRAGRASGSAAEARAMGLLPAADGITMNPERLVGDAKALALSLERNYVPVTPRDDILAGGEALYAKLKISVWLDYKAGRLTHYDTVVAEKLAHVLSGGRLTGAQAVSEQYLLDLEREAFLSLCGNEQTQQRIEHMLKTGKPLRN